jgi:hypothetical protein
MSIKTTICTRHAKLFDFRDPRPEAISVADVCEALAKLCRFTGHCRGFYTVAAHSLLVAHLLTHHYDRPDLALEGVLHELGEAYMNDVNSPLKGECPDYKTIQRRIDVAGAERFGLRLDDATKRVVKAADWDAYCIEQGVLMPREAFLVDELAGRAPEMNPAFEAEAAWVIAAAERGDWKQDRAEFAFALAKAMKERNVNA